MFSRFVCSLAVAACLLLSSSVSAQRVAPSQDFKKYDVILFTNQDWQSIPQESRLVSAFNSGELANLKKSSNFVHYTQAEPVYLAGRYWQIQPKDFPVLIVAHSQQYGGGYFFKASKDSMPSVSELFDQIRSAYHRDAAANKDNPVEANSQLSTPAGQDCDDGSCKVPPRSPLLPNAPWNQPSELDVVEGLFGPSTPIRDSLGYGAWILTAIIALIFLSVVFFGFVLVVSITIWVFRK